MWIYVLKYIRWQASVCKCILPHNVYRKLNRILWNIGILYYFFISLLVKDWFAHTKGSHTRKKKLNQNKRYNNSSNSSIDSNNIARHHQLQMTIVNKRSLIKFVIHIMYALKKKEQKNSNEQFIHNDMIWCSAHELRQYCSHFKVWLALYIFWILPFDLTIVSFNFVIVNESYEFITYTHSCTRLGAHTYMKITPTIKNQRRCCAVSLEQLCYMYNNNNKSITIPTEQCAAYI